ncbi:unnamed protein product, partial [Darwinula stevensoni]
MDQSDEESNTKMGEGCCLWSIASNIITYSVLAWAGVQFSHLIKRLFIHGFGSYPSFTSYGTWAVVTGCTDGIGLSYAKELARRGMKIVLISRNPKKLEAVALRPKLLNSQSEEQFDTETLMIPADFTELDIYDGIKEKVAGRDIGVLVNNVGMASDPQPFLDVPEGEKTFQDMLLVNNMSMVRMTHMILPGMVKKGKGVVINVSSVAGISPVPFMTTYSATKFSRTSLNKVEKFVLFITLTIRKDVTRTRGIEYQRSSKNLDSKFVYTKMADKFLDRPGLTAPTPDTFVRSDLRSIPKIQVTSGYWFHNLMVRS